MELKDVVIGKDYLIATSPFGNRKQVTANRILADWYAEGQSAIEVIVGRGTALFCFTPVRAHQLSELEPIKAPAPKLFRKYKVGDEVRIVSKEAMLARGGEIQSSDAIHLAIGTPAFDAYVENCMLWYGVVTTIRSVHVQPGSDLCKYHLEGSCYNYNDEMLDLVEAAPMPSPAKPEYVEPPKRTLMSIEEIFEILKHHPILLADGRLYYPLIKQSGSEIYIHGIAAIECKWLDGDGEIRDFFRDNL